MKHLPLHIIDDQEYSSSSGNSRSGSDENSGGRRYIFNTEIPQVHFSVLRSKLGNHNNIRVLLLN